MSDTLLPLSEIGHEPVTVRLPVVYTRRAGKPTFRHWWECRLSKPADCTTADFKPFIILAEVDGGLRSRWCFEVVSYDSESRVLVLREYRIASSKRAGLERALEALGWEDTRIERENDYGGER